VHLKWLQCSANHSYYTLFLLHIHQSYTALKLGPKVLCCRTLDGCIGGSVAWIAIMCSVQYELKLNCTGIQCRGIQWTALHCTEVQCHYTLVQFKIAVFYSAVQCSVVQCSAVQCSVTVLYPPPSQTQSLFPPDNVAFVCWGFLAQASWSLIWLGTRWLPKQQLAEEPMMASQT
jgi:hypothetical protein